MTEYVDRLAQIQKILIDQAVEDLKQRISTSLYKRQIIENCVRDEKYADTLNDLLLKEGYPIYHHYPVLDIVSLSIVLGAISTLGAKSLHEAVIQKLTQPEKHLNEQHTYH